MSTLHTQQRIVILGGGYAGLMAAARLALAQTGAIITLIDARANFVHRIRLHEMLAGSEPPTFPYAPLLARRGINFVQGYVNSIEPARQRVIGRDQDQQPFALDYDYLIVALGSYSTAHAPGVAEYAVRLNDPAAIQQGRQRLHDLARRQGRVLIVGGGLTSIETATEIAERIPGLQISLALRDTIGDGYSVRGARHLHKRFADLGIDVMEETKIIGIEQTTAYATTGEIPFELCVWTAGFAASPLAREAGLSVDSFGRIIVDPQLQAISQPNIYAVGDAAAVDRLGYPLRMGCVSAMPMGAYVGKALGQRLHGISARPFAFDYPLRCISLGRRDALVQWTTPADAPLARVWSGMPAVATKALICRLTFDAVHSELRWGGSVFAWAQANHARGTRRLMENQA